MPDKRHVFINCPFDQEYLPLFHALVFAVHDCGFRARCALESDDGTVTRMSKLISIVRDCPYGIHDISRTELDPEHELPRFNMPFELGVFLGAKHFGAGSLAKKKALILDREQYRYQKFISDLAGIDIQSHADDASRAIGCVRNWLSTESEEDLPGREVLVDRYARFRQDLPSVCESFQLHPDNLVFNDLVRIVVSWLRTKVEN